MIPPSLAWGAGMASRAASWAKRALGVTGAGAGRFGLLGAGIGGAVGVGFGLLKAGVGSNQPINRIQGLHQ